jgi:hypothetical protein
VTSKIKQLSVKPKSRRNHMPNIATIGKITEKIYRIRGVKVMVDKDLAALYGFKNKVLKQAVRRNIDRFPLDFMFELSKKEYPSLRSQNVTLKRGQHSKYLPFFSLSRALPCFQAS